jgi:hypothetical protein
MELWADDKGDEERNRLINGIAIIYFISVVVM